MNQEESVKRRKSKGSKSKGSESNSIKKSSTKKSKKKVDESVDVADDLQIERQA